MSKSCRKIQRSMRILQIIATHLIWTLLAYIISLPVQMLLILEIRTYQYDVWGKLGQWFRGCWRRDSGISSARGIRKSVQLTICIMMKKGYILIQKLILTAWKSLINVPWQELIIPAKLHLKFNNRQHLFPWYIMMKTIPKSPKSRLHPRGVTDYQTFELGSKVSSVKSFVMTLMVQN